MAQAAKVLRRLDTAGIPDDFPMPKSRYAFGISWDAVEGRPKVDIDLQCVVVNEAGVITDCAYYNNLKAAGGIAHSGDEITGAAAGIDEIVWVLPNKLKQEAKLLIFVVACYQGGNLRDVVNGRLHVLEETMANEVASFDMERSEGQVDVVACMFRGDNGSWTLRIIDEPAQEGQHFMDILGLLAEVVRVFIPSAPRRQKVAFAMEKGSVMDLPKTLSSITIGLGWDAEHVQGKNVDLDVSAVLLDANGREADTVYFQQLQCKIGCDIKHSGDNLTGEGDGDDEQITAVLPTIVPHVQQVCFVINIYSPGVTFREVKNPYCRVVDNSTGAELCRYSLRDAGGENGLVVAKIAREAGERWGFHALGLPCVGRTYKDSLPRIQQVCMQPTRLLMDRGATFDRGGGGGGMPRPSAPPPPQPESACGGCLPMPTSPSSRCHGAKTENCAVQ